MTNRDFARMHNEYLDPDRHQWQEPSMIKPPEIHLFASDEDDLVINVKDLITWMQEVLEQAGDDGDLAVYHLAELSAYLVSQREKIL